MFISVVHISIFGESVQIGDSTVLSGWWKFQSRKHVATNVFFDRCIRSHAFVVGRLLVSNWGEPNAYSREELFRTFFKYKLMFTYSVRLFVVRVVYQLNYCIFLGKSRVSIFRCWLVGPFVSGFIFVERRDFYRWYNPVSFGLASQCEWPKWSMQNTIQPVKTFSWSFVMWHVECSWQAYKIIVDV